MSCITELENVVHSLLQVLTWDALTAIGTLLAVLVALFLEPIRRWWRTPELFITWQERDSENQPADDFGAVVTSVRIRVVNNGREPAQRVEVVVSDVCHCNNDGSLELVHFLPTALRWTPKQLGAIIYQPEPVDCAT